jgi:glyoxylase-like metal-dependent hydrolase (beta-lactamase superfamily II)
LTRVHAASEIKSTRNFLDFLQKKNGKATYSYVTLVKKEFFMKIIQHPFSNSLQLKASLFPINCFIIKEKDFCTLIDCNTKKEAEPIIQALEQTKLPLKYIIVTHGHSDHIGDIKKIRDHFPQAAICVGAKEMADSKSTTAKIKIPLEPDILLAQGDQIGSLLVQETPGHTHGSISLIDQRSFVAYVGDLLQTQGGLAISGDTRWAFPFPALATADKQAAITSTQKLIHDFPLTYIFCGHGSVVAYNEALFQKTSLRAQAKIH